MKSLKPFFIILTLLVPFTGTAQTTARAERAWKPFIAAFHAAVKSKDREALYKMMSSDFYYLSSGGDENGDQDTRNEAFEYWQTAGVGSWEELDRILTKGTAPNVVLREPGNRRPSKVSPPLANNRRAIKAHEFPWYAVFEFRNGKWLCIAFTECCEEFGGV